MAEPFDSIAASVADVIDRLARGEITEVQAATALSPLLTAVNDGEFAQRVDEIVNVVGRITGLLLVEGPPSNIIGAPGSYAWDRLGKVFYGPKDRVTGWPAGDAMTEGPPGRDVELRKSATHVQWRVEGATAWTDLIPLSDLAGSNGKEVELQATATHIQWRLTGGAWADLIALSVLKGADGREVSLQKSATHVQWRLGTGPWIDLVPLIDLQGANWAKLTEAYRRAGLAGVNDLGAASSLVQAGTHLDFAGDYYRQIEAVSSLLTVPGMAYSRSGAATAWRADGTLATFAANVPRITDLGVLIEGAATNLFPYWDPTATQIPNKANCADVAAPAAAPLAGRNWIALNNAAAMATAYQVASIAASTVYSVQVLVETPDGSQPVHGVDNSSGDFRFLVGGAGLNSPAATYKRLSGNVWLVVVMGTSQAAPNTAVGIVRFTTQNTRALKFSGFDLKTGSDTNSPIITTGAAAARGADNLRQTGLGAALSQPWTVFAEAEDISGIVGVTKTLLSISNDNGTASGTVVNRIALFRSGAVAFTMQVLANNAGLASTSAGSGSIVGRGRAAMAWDGATLTGSINGVAFPSIVLKPADFSAPMNRADFFIASGSGTSALRGFGRRHLLIPQALTQAQLNALTTVA